MKNEAMQIIGVGDLTDSPSNPRGGRFAGAEFDELVASVREKGVLTPIIVRAKGNGHEIIAGHRRVAAAKEAGLKEVAAVVVVADDREAKEIQIIENLQRADVHPLDEAESFKFLADKREKNVAEIAARVGKSERYVRDRLGLTNLIPAAQKAFRAGQLDLTSAIVISKCEVESVQKGALDNARNGWGSESIKKDIGKKMYVHFGSKPWAKDEKLAELLGDTKRATLFGKDMDEVDDPVKHARMMAAYIELEIRKHEAKGEKIVKISTSYGSSDMKGVLSRDQYRELETAKERADATEDILGIVVEGYQDEGKVLKITTAPEDLKGSSQAAHKLTPKERAERKKQRELEAKAKEKRNAKIIEGIGKVKMPLSEKHLDVLFDVCFRRFGYSYIQPVATRHGIKAVKMEENGYSRRDLETPVREYFEKKGKNGKLQFIFEVGLEAVGGSHDGELGFIKKL